MNADSTSTSLTALLTGWRKAAVECRKIEGKEYAKEREGNRMAAERAQQYASRAATYERCADALERALNGAEQPKDAVKGDAGKLHVSRNVAGGHWLMVGGYTLAKISVDRDQHLDEIDAWCERANRTEQANGDAEKIRRVRQAFRNLSGDPSKSEWSRGFCDAFAFVAEALTGETMLTYRMETRRQDIEKALELDD